MATGSWRNEPSEDRRSAVVDFPGRREPSLFLGELRTPASFTVRSISIRSPSSAPLTNLAGRPTTLGAGCGVAATGVRLRRRRRGGHGPGLELRHLRSGRQLLGLRAWKTGRALGGPSRVVRRWPHVRRIAVTVNGGVESGQAGRSVIGVGLSWSSPWPCCRAWPSGGPRPGSRDTTSRETQHACTGHRQSCKAARTSTRSSVQQCLPAKSGKLPDSKPPVLRNYRFSWVLLATACNRYLLALEPSESTR